MAMLIVIGMLMAIVTSQTVRARLWVGEPLREPVYGAGRKAEIGGRTAENGTLGDREPTSVTAHRPTNVGATPLEKPPLQKQDGIIVPQMTEMLEKTVVLNVVMVQLVETNGTSNGPAC